MKVNQSDVIDCTSTHVTQKDPGSRTKIWLTVLKKKRKKKKTQNRNATRKIQKLIFSCVFWITRHTNLKIQHNDLPLFPYYGSRTVGFIPVAAERTEGWCKYRKGAGIWKSQYWTFPVKPKQQLVKKSLEPKGLWPYNGTQVTQLASLESESHFL